MFGRRLKSVSRSALPTVCLLLLALSWSQTAPARTYILTRLFTVEGQGLPNFRVTEPTINNLGEVGYTRGVYDPVDRRTEAIVIVDDGTTETELINLTEAGFDGGTGETAINDVGMVFVFATSAPALNGVLRIDPDGTTTPLATSPGDFGSLASRSLSVNRAGRVAMTVTRNDGVTAVLRIDAAGVFTEIANADPLSSPLINLTGPTINDSGVVAFKAQDDLTGLNGVYTGDGTALPTLEGTTPPGAGTSGFAPVINDSGLTLSDGSSGPPAVLFTAQGGTVDIVLIGTEDRMFQQLKDGYAFNNLDEFAAITKPIAQPVDFGLFVGTDLANDTVVRLADLVFAGTAIEGVITDMRMTHGSMNDGGQIAFLLQTAATENGTIASHVVLADPDTDEDGLMDRLDNCPLDANPNQDDNDGDGAGDACDLDDDNDGVPDTADAFPLNEKETKDADGDGMGDNFEARFGFNPQNPSDASLDSDSDGLTNLQEFQRGRNPRVNEGAVGVIIDSILLE